MRTAFPSPEGLIIARSEHGPAETLKRAEEGIAKRGMTIFARIDHADGARSVAMDLRPTEVLIFGSPKAGTPLMQASDTIGLDLPLKLLIRQDADGETFLAYDDPAWHAKRHGLGEAAEPIIAKMQAVMAAIAGEAAAGSP